MIFHISWNLRRCAALLLVLFMLPASAFAKATENTPSQNIPAAEARSQVVRVLLSRLGLANRLDITLDGVYSIGNRQGEANMIFDRGSELTLIAQNGSLTLYYKGMRLGAGAGLYLTRYQADDGVENGLRLMGQGALYEGDLQLTLEGDVIRPILHIHVEDYLHGVVPYEMSNDFPLEALKAQAVTARTYALRKQDATKEYDLVDTTNDQVYKGRLQGYEQAAQAVEETRGVCGFYKNKLAQCFYGASNGGQTELVEHVWTGGGDYGYYQMIDDPYDLENPLSPVKVFEVKKKPVADTMVSYGLRTVLAEALKDELTAKGYDPAPESLRVDAVTALFVDTPAFAKPSRLMTKLSITFQYSGRTRTEGVLPTARKVDEDDQEVSLFGTLIPKEAKDTPTPIVAPADAAEDSTPEPTPLPTPEPVYGEFEKVEEPVTLTLDIFPEVKSALALSMNGSSNNEMLTVVEKKDRFQVEARRYGHGVGMSQRGAEWMAAKYEKSYVDILGFYYPGMTLKQYPTQDEELPLLNEEQMSTPGPLPTPTPKPTLMPVTQEAKDGAWYAVVSEIDDDSSLNLRVSPDMSGDILMKLFKNQRLLVLERCPEEGWLKVRTDVVEGYVMEKFLKAE